MKFLGFCYMGFGLMSEFSCWNLWHENGRVFAEDEICYFRLLVREYCRRSRRLCAVEFMPHKRDCFRGR